MGQRTLWGTGVNPPGTALTNQVPGVPPTPTRVLGKATLFLDPELMVPGAWREGRVLKTVQPCVEMRAEALLLWDGAIPHQSPVVPGKQAGPGPSLSLEEGLLQSLAEPALPSSFLLTLVDPWTLQAAFGALPHPHCATSFATSSPPLPPAASPRTLLPGAQTILMG